MQISNFDKALPRYDPRSRFLADLEKLFKRFAKKNPNAELEGDKKYIVMEEINMKNNTHGQGSLEFLLDEANIDFKWSEIEEIIPNNFEGKMGVGLVTFNELI